ncbi:methylated-DNA--[protein]-cysteine S-methyltransferase [Vitreoscilla massiliensis]|uniref:Methylated-DNA--[protein]-cysteine S-methyltransferase n=1 Tax=Vitreoscilla massiliensis TaxID=1689272 RepID=A0ABY4DYX2_9NEIS|nr:methylated-DNA--[protein]-cysteine S-methyltransferase [Vitreoscilla massiliensis]UOO88721.1 methylated-DNA--[protein]-cysteine S-methyltransferase [Vitreoscilla massiliensis]
MTDERLRFEQMAAAIAYLYDHAQAQPSLNEVAAHLGMSPQHLQRQFQLWTGVSPKKMLQHISIGNAKKVLQQQGSVLAAALDSGLSGTGRLHDLFVQLEGMTPGAYKQGGADLTICYHYGDSIYGEVLLACTDVGVCWLAFVDDRAVALADLQAAFPHARLRQQAHGLHAPVWAFLQQGKTDVPIALQVRATPFQLKVWQALLQIPEGRLRSYGDIAHSLGHDKAARAVGSAVARNPIAVLIPCHRVIRDSGIIGDYRWGRGRKMALLGQELPLLD